MTPKSKIAAAGLLALSALGLATVAGAQATTPPSGDNAAEAQAFAGASVPLAQAVSAAEAQGGGKVMSIDFDEAHDGKPSAWEVEVLMPDGTVTNLLVNAADGTVAPDSETDDGQGTNGGQGDGDGESDDDGEGGENEGNEG